MFEALSHLPAEVAAVVAVLLLSLGALGWSMVNLIHGPRAKIKRRLAVIGGGAVQTRRHGRQPKRKSVQTRLKQVEGVRTGQRGYRLREQLMQAGLHWEVWHYMAGCGALGLGAFGGAILMSLGVLWGLVLALVVGFGLPKLVVSIAARRRIKTFTSQFAEAIDVVVRGISSGLPLGECINIIGREMGDPIGKEFRLITEGQKLGLSLQEVLARAVERMPTAELRYFSIVIAIQQQTGGNLADTLAKLSEVLRARKRMRDKVQAYASEARASAYIIGSLPLIVICALSVLSPSYIAPLFNTDTGHVLLSIGGITEVVGLFVMSKMINFDM